jgi:CheY-like chemotaxis protein
MALEFAGVQEQDVVGKLFWETPWWIHSQEEQRKLQEAMDKGCNGFIQKPFNLSELSQKVRKILDAGKKPQRIEMA